MPQTSTASQAGCVPKNTRSRPEMTGMPSGLVVKFSPTPTILRSSALGTRSDSNHVIAVVSSTLRLFVEPRCFLWVCGSKDDDSTVLWVVASTVMVDIGYEYCTVFGEEESSTLTFCAGSFHYQYHTFLCSLSFFVVLIVARCSLRFARSHGYVLCTGFHPSR